MESINITDMCKVGATCFAGLFAGGCLYINMVQTPALRTVKDTSSYRLYWEMSYRRAGKVLPGFALCALVDSSIVYYRSASEQKYLWLTGGLIIISVVPWTKFAMHSEIRGLCEDGVISKRGETWVRDAVLRWDKLHIARTMMGMTGFGIFLYALYARI